MTRSAGTGLVRAMGRWSLTALMVNSIIGSGIFGLPSVVAGLVGNRSPLAVLLAGAAIGVIMACFAEVASQFTQAGGPYLYARVGFGRLIGIETGWLLWMARITSPAANANLLVSYLGEFWPHTREAIPRLIILTLLVGLVGLVNYRGVRAGTQMSNLFTIGKLLPLLIVIVAGILYLSSGHPVIHPVSSPAPARDWLKAMLLLIFAYGGFESALTPMAEAKDPQRDAAFGLFAALITCALVYTLIQIVVAGVLPDPAQSDRPLADAARLLMGKDGALLISIGALVSVYGNVSASTLAGPRITFALAEEKDFPRIFAAVHPRFRTPYFSILVFASLTWLFAVFGSFSWNATLSAAARLFYYALTCAALPVLRRKQPGAAFFRLPGGPFFAVVGVLICLALASRIDLSGFFILVATILVALVNWIWVRQRKPVEVRTS